MVPTNSYFPPNGYPYTPFDNSSGSSDGGLEAFDEFDFNPEIRQHQPDHRCTGCFWRDVKEIEGEDYLGGINMQGLLKDRKRPAHPPMN